MLPSQSQRNHGLVLQKKPQLPKSQPDWRSRKAHQSCCHFAWTCRPLKIVGVGSQFFSTLSKQRFFSSFRALQVSPFKTPFQGSRIYRVKFRLLSTERTRSNRWGSWAPCLERGKSQFYPRIDGSFWAIQLWLQYSFERGSTHSRSGLAILFQCFP